MKKTSEAKKRATMRFLAKNQALRLWRSAKNNAKARGVLFDLLKEDVVLPETCAYLGIPLTNVMGEGRVLTNASIDRLDPTKGYVKGNIQIISDLANRMKSSTSTEQLVAFARSVLRIHAEERAEAPPVTLRTS